MKKIYNIERVVGIIVALVISHFAAYPVGRWFVAQYWGSGEFFIGPFSGYLDGFLLSYVFVGSLLIAVTFNKLKSGIYAVLPVFAFDIFISAYDPQLWMHLILLAAGLGIAYLILLLTRKSGKKIF